MDTSKDVGKEDASAEHVELPSQCTSSFQIPEVTWWKHTGLRKLYALMPILLLGRLSSRKKQSIMSTEFTCRINDQRI